MRLIAILSDKGQVGSMLDSLKNAGFDRKDMIVSDLEKQKNLDPGEIIKEQTMLQMEEDSIRLGETGKYCEGIENLSAKEGILVAVEIPRHSIEKVKKIMEQSGADDIVQD